jgi:hypothetical protein
MPIIREIMKMDAVALDILDISDIMEGDML